MTTRASSSAAALVGAETGWLPHPPPPVTAAAARPHILVIEDDAELRRLIAAALRRLHYDVVEAPDGIAALDYLRPWLFGRRGTPPPDAIVSDVRMPGWTGLEILDAVRSAGLELPVILITAFGAHDTHATARRLGATVTLDKPFEVGTLCRIVRDALAARA